MTTKKTLTVDADEGFSYASLFKNIRGLVGLTAEDLSLEIGVTKTTILNWESGKSKIPFEAFIKTLALKNGKICIELE